MTAKGRGFLPPLFYTGYKMKTIFSLIFFFAIYAACCNWPDQTFALYNSKKDSLKDGVTKIENVLFVQTTTILSENIAKERRKGEMEGMLGTQQALKHFYLSPEKINLQFNFDPSTKLYRQLKKQIMDKQLSLREFSFSTNCRVLFNGMSSRNEYRYVIAVPYDNALKQSQIMSISLQQWVTALKEYRESLNEDEEKLATFYQELSSIESAVYWQKELLEYKYTLNNFPYTQNSLETPPVQSADEANKLSKTANGNLSSAVYFAQRLIQQKSYLSALTMVLSAVCNVDEYSKKKKELSTILELYADNNNSAKQLLSEYGSYLDLVANEITRNKLSLSQHSTAAYGIYTPFNLLVTAGHSVFSGDVSSSMTDEYKEAAKLFSQGTNLDEIIILLHKAKNKAPAYSPNYSLLGSALLAKKDYLYATLNLTQAIQLNPDNGDGDAKTTLAICYNKLGFKKLAVGMAWDALIAEKTSAWSNKRAMEILSQ